MWSGEITKNKQSKSLALHMTNKMERERENKSFGRWFNEREKENCYHVMNICFGLSSDRKSVFFLVVL